MAGQAALFDPGSHTPLAERAWDADRARALVRQVSSAMSDEVGLLQALLAYLLDGCGELVGWRKDCLPDPDVDEQLFEQTAGDERVSAIDGPVPLPVDGEWLIVRAGKRRLAVGRRRR